MMKVIVFFLFLSANLILAQSDNFKVSDLNNKERAKNFVATSKTCELLTFVNNNIKHFANPKLIDQNEIVFLEISKRTKRQIILQTHSRHLQEYINEIREGLLKEQIESLRKESCK